MANLSDTKEWFTETEALWPGQRFALQMEKVLYRGKSDFQDILVFESSTYGNVLVLDGIIQATERDEFAYQEMISHLPLFAHAEPKNVLIVGGGDGGVLREVVKHDCVERIVMCEIDPKVCEVSKQFFATSLAVAFDDRRLHLIHADAAKYLKDESSEKFDVIIVDSSDPVGPAQVLFQTKFYQDMRDALSTDGIICTQGECLWLHLDLIKTVMSECNAIFPTVQYAYTTIPTYPSGQIGFVICANEKTDLRKPKRGPTPDMEKSLRYYSPSMHHGAFILPAFAERAIEQVRKG
uniref:Uncharacterized protein ALNC14_055480 n=1 Tax=Albugo laibachii Nc14 TaxID=890382 RepID=F0WDX7_9STRA|nr:unnamed protein product [Albugo laibachii Nc14]|eukprot:CCA19405.1 unnamed protein product [Albugo laibachii Nc14]